MQYLRLFIRSVLLENQGKELITEPDDNDDRDDSIEKEASVSASVGGVTTPLGTGPTYPDKPIKKKRKTPAEAAGSAFGGAQPVVKKR